MKSAANEIAGHDAAGDDRAAPRAEADGRQLAAGTRFAARAGSLLRYLLVAAALAAALVAAWLTLWAYRLARGVFLPGNLQLELHLVEVALLAVVAGDLLLRLARSARPRFGLREAERGLVPVAGRLVVGHDSEGASLVVSAPQVSRRHFELEEGAAELRLRDLGSRNGTFVNGRDIREKGPVELRAGDRIEAGLAGPCFVVEPLPAHGLIPASLRTPALLALLWTGLFLGWRSNLSRLPEASLAVGAGSVSFAPFRDSGPFLALASLLTAVVLLRRATTRRLSVSPAVLGAMEAVEALLVVGVVVLYPLLPAEGLRYAEAAIRTAEEGKETALGPLAGNLAARGGAHPWQVTYFRQAGLLALLWATVAFALSRDRARSVLGAVVPFLSRPLVVSSPADSPGLFRRGLRLLLYRDVFVGFLAAAVVVATVWTPLGTTLGRGKRLFLALPGLGPVQSVEVVKALFVLFVAAYFWRHQKLFESAPRARYLLPFVVACGLTVALTAVQADMGGLLMLGLFVSAMFALGTGHLRLLAVIPALVGAGFALALLLGRGDVVWARLGIWLSPRDHPLGEQVVNARQLLLSVGTTGFEPGRALAWSIPDVHGDLAIAAVAERYGLVGVLSLLAVEVCVLLSLVALARRARVGALLPAGVAVLLLVQVLTQAGGLVGLIPFTGVPLPWLSHGLTASAVFTLLVGLALAVPTDVDLPRRAAPALGRRLAAFARGAVGSVAVLGLAFAAWAALLPALGTFGFRGRDYRWTDLSRQRSIARLVSVGAFVADEDGRGFRATPDAAALAASAGLDLDPRLVANALRKTAEGPAPASYLVTNPNRFADRPLPRGRILARDGTPLAITERAGRRVYPLDAATIHAVGLSGGRVAPFGVEGALSPLLDGSDLPRTARIAAFAWDVHRGLDVELTLDPRLQTKASAALGGRRGAAVVLDLRDGAVLALASSPAPKASDRAGRRWLDVLDDPARPLLDRAISSTAGYCPPGSTFKIVMAAAGLLNRDRFDPAATETCTGYDPELKVRCAHGAVHGQVDLARALEVSCNIYFARLAVRLGPEAIREAAARFGFNAGKPLDLAEGSGAGAIVVTPSTAADDLAAVATPSMLARVGFGQGAVSATPFQMARAAAVIATGGRLLDPHLVSSLSLGSGEGGSREAAWRRRIRPGHGTAVLPASIARQLNSALRGVFEAPGGTARRLPRLWASAGAWRLSPTSPGRGWTLVPIAGKTGTAWRTARGQAEDAWMFAWAPATAPRVLACVMLEGAGTGGAVAGPITVELVRAGLEAVGEAM